MLNCLGWALGLETGVDNVYPRTYTLENPNAVVAFKTKLSELGFDCRLLAKGDVVSEDESLVAFWGLYPIRDMFLDFVSFVYDFHVASFTNGHWMHKHGWVEEPAECSIEELAIEYGSQPYYFAIQKRTP